MCRYLITYEYTYLYGDDEYEKRTKEEHKKRHQDMEPQLNLYAKKSFLSHEFYEFFGFLLFFAREL